MSYLRNIKRLSRADNLGGILILKVARKDDIESIPDPVGSIISGNIVFKAGKGFVTWEATLESVRSQSNSRANREGTSRQNRITFTVPKDDALIKAQLDQAEGDEIIILITDGNGNNKLFGQLDLPVKLEYDHDSGATFGNLNHYQCSINYQGPNNIFFYSGAVTPQPAGTSPAIVQFSTGELIASLNPSDVLVVSSDFTHTFTQYPGSSPSGIPAIVKWDDDTPIASLQPGDILVVETDFDFDFEIVGSL
ncbi:MAG TPA: hypothetical protein VGK59_23765 [Ohtaekwangia sp.]